MWHRTKGCRLAALALISALVCGNAFAQGDYGMHKGDAARTGRNGAPLANNPGHAYLNWWRPNILDLIGVTTVVDNPSPATSLTGVWGQPASVSDEAFNPFFNPNDDPLLIPSYRYSFTVPADSSADPTVSSDPNLATFTWTVAPAGGPQNVGLYVWLPIGPTTIAGNPSFTQRYWAYKIQYGPITNRRTWIETIDSFAAGTGWVRFGSQAGFNHQLFDYDGVTPITITLYNTVPRDSNNNLTDSPGITLVYADAVMAVQDLGVFKASPVISQINGGVTTHAVGARTVFELAIREGVSTTVEVGEARSYDILSSATRWIFRPNLASPDLTVFQDNQSAGVTVGPGWTAQTLPVGFKGTDYLSQPITNNIGLMSDVNFAPTLEDGSYEVWVHLQGSTLPTVFAQSQQVEIHEGLQVTTFTVDANVGGGWVRLGGTTRYTHDNAGAADLTVHMTNYSANPADLGLLAYADAVRFVGAANTAINSTPVSVNALVRMGPGAPVARDVTLVCAENGKIYCLDSNGNGNGTTNIIWTYPSTPPDDDPTWSDPNQVAGLDGVGPIAEMPIGFDMSSALVQRIGGVDYLFVGTKNGRVYCIDMDGRGDMDFAAGDPGTTTRRWTWPDDYPSNRRTSHLGPIVGSVAYADTAQGPTIFVPTQEGRLYAIEALGNVGNHTTNTRWSYPDVNAPNLGSVITSPTVEFGNVYFGSMAPAGDVGHFLAVDMDNGNLVWDFSNVPPSPIWGGLASNNFISGPATIPATEMVGMPDIVVAANDNGYITAFDAQTGVIQWTTNELGSSVTGSLSYTPLIVYNNAGAFYATPQPCVIVPTEDGRLAALFAETAKHNTLSLNNRLAWGFDTNSGRFDASAAIGRNYMMAADGAGYIYAFNDNPVAISPGNPPGQQEIVPDDPLGIPFREAKLVFITAATYQNLRGVTGSPGHMTWAQANNPAAQNPTPNPAFEWGETFYLMVYNFPYNPAGLPDPPYQAPQSEFRFNVEGAGIRNVTVRAKRFSGVSPTSPITGATLDAYCIVSFTVQGSGNTAIPPGAAAVEALISAQFAPGAGLQNVTLNPAETNKPFRVANPIGIGVNFDNAGNPLPLYSLGYTINATDPEALMNGSQNIPATAKLENRLLANAGVVEHNQKANRQVALYDRSLMTLIRGNGRGLDMVRASRSDLAFRGGPGAIVKPLNPLAYPSFEDTPTRFPNRSLDYPDIQREHITLIKDRFGNAEDPLFYGSSLKPPTSPSNPFDPTNRVLIKTPLDVDMNIPRFQPANLSQIMESSGLTVDGGGYSGDLNIYIDSDNNGQHGRIGNRREAYRTMIMSASVSIDEKLFVGTPTVDLGALPTGTGFRATGNPFPWNANSVNPLDYGPQWPPYDEIYQTFRVYNEGNVNLTNVRLAKDYFDPVNNRVWPWGLFAPANHERSWLDTHYNLWSEIDTKFAPINTNVVPNQNFVIIQKPRVGDRSPSELSINPKQRVNENLNVFTEGHLFNLANVPDRAPKISVTIPIGFPIGTYASQIRVIEDREDNEVLEYVLLPGGVWQANNSFSDPTMTLRFNVREARVTQGYTRYTAPMFENLIVGNERFIHQNVQPAAMRDQFGNLVVAYTSNEPAYNTPVPLSESLNDQWRVYLGTITGTVPPGGVGSSFLPDLNTFLPSGGATYFRQEVGPYPVNPATLFAVGPGESVIANTVKFGAPSLPPLGPFDPYGGPTHPTNYMALLGEAQIQGAGSRRGASVPFVGSFTTAINGAITTMNISPLSTVEGGIKGRPAIVATGGGNGTVFFAGGGSGQTQLYAQSFHDNNTNSFGLGTQFQVQTGSGFEYVGEPSAFARIYNGLSVQGLNNGAQIFELGFTGKLRGRPHPEVFFGRLLGGGTFGGLFAGQGGRPVFTSLPEQFNERLSRDGEVGSFRALGIDWNLNSTIELDMSLNGAAPVNIEVPNTRDIDRQTNLVSFDTILGGKVYIDAALGTIRFAGTAPAQSAVLTLRYTPRVIRVSSGVGGGFAAPTMMFDNRNIGEWSYWANANNTPLVPPGGPIPDTSVRTSRFMFIYNRAAAGAGQTSRPYLKTLRLGVQLPLPVHTQSNGAVTALTVNGATVPYQIDPANGRVYFQDPDENRLVNITYTPVDEATGLALAPILLQEVRVQLILERNEAPIAIDQALNEAQPYAFYDPFDFVGAGSAARRRPGLVWLFWTSTRAGGPDIYFETIAPRFTPAPVGRQ